ncbi:MAG: 2-C-methyl-D-erythritol 4-phosphate cytidylyltransferase [Lachnospiraceae bacterium]|nr:2-C-methyl-D-erythritol 4-phosphate cytidylyltransferase [Lachnospiraceae bacterium]
MVFGVILAGGIGSRMGNAEKPKQYLNIGNKPIILHTIEKFYVHEGFERLIVLCPKEWVEHTRHLVQNNFPDDKVVVLEGGVTRNETIMNAIRYIENEYGLQDDTLLVTHDSVRPFLTHRIIEENIKYGLKYGAVDTVIPATDTIVESGDGDVISQVPDRSKMYQGQTPQTFNAKKLKELYYSLSEEEKDVLTDASKIFVIKGEKVHLVQGEVFNIKITYPYDLRVAESLLNNEGESLC